MCKAEFAVQFYLIFKFIYLILFKCEIVLLLLSSISDYSGLQASVYA